MRKPIVPPPAWAFLFGLAMWQLDRRLPVAQLLDPPLSNVGALGVLAGLAIDAACIRRFARARTTPNPLSPAKASALVTGGMYRYTRNPMYVGLLLVLCGWALWLGSLSPWIGPPLFVALLTAVQIRPEEAALRGLFGRDYAAYCERVPRWIGVSRER